MRLIIVAPVSTDSTGERSRRRAIRRNDLHKLGEATAFSRYGLDRKTNRKKRRNESFSLTFELTLPAPLSTRSQLLPDSGGVRGTLAIGHHRAAECEPISRTRRYSWTARFGRWAQISHTGRVLEENGLFLRSV